MTLNLTNNTITNNSSNSGGGVYAGGHGNTTLSFLNNIIARNNANDGGGIYVNSGLDTLTSITLTNNTITDNEAGTDDGGGVYVSSWNGTTAVDLKNSITWGNNAAGDGNDIFIIKNRSGGDSIVNASYSDIGDIVIDPTYPGTYNDLGNNINTDPNFKDPSSGNYHLDSGSLCHN